MQVADGQLKFSVEIENWPWSEDGVALDVDIIIKLPQGRSVEVKGGGGGSGERKGPKAYDLGKNAVILFSRKVPTFQVLT